MFFPLGEFSLGWAPGLASGDRRHKHTRTTPTPHSRRTAYRYHSALHPIRVDEEPVASYVRVVHLRGGAARSASRQPKPRRWTKLSSLALAVHHARGMAAEPLLVRNAPHLAPQRQSTVHSSTSGHSHRPVCHPRSVLLADLEVINETQGSATSQRRHRTARARCKSAVDAVQAYKLVPIRPNLGMPIPYSHLNRHPIMLEVDSSTGPINPINGQSAAK